ncbi:helix-turn-helix transcriptional regulator [Streptomyces rectiverticillatus]|uniref:helix-turn-helix transcriptional regulator n=1 Tax=Streptomyces rectiverticillatus TaxID=173860 RepID=UPI0015C3BF5B|nr:helix-turn-helix transcriptional regulator [Streptomyces rectiverticillatus]QLE71140.1 helix-turn-helix transcriptional regulator [Streptomyces rectiverticillatus]
MAVGDEIRKLRTARRLTQGRLARLLNIARWGDESAARKGTCTGHYVYRWEKGLRHPEDWLPFLEQVLEADLCGYGDSPAPDVDVVDVEGLVPPVDRRAFFGAGAVAGIALSTPSAMAQGRRIGQADVVRAGRRLAALRRLDDYSGGVSVYPKVVAEIDHLASMAAHGTYSDSVGRSLLSTLAELYQFASWTAFDAGRIPHARKYAQAAASAANQAGNATLGATALSELSYLTASTSDPNEGVAMAEASLACAPRNVLPAVSVVLADRLAWACARTGNAAGAERALGLSEAAHDKRDTSRVEEPDTVYWINREETEIMAGRCWAELRQPKRAVPILENLTAPYDDTHAREVGLYACWLAGSYLDAGALDEATASAERAANLSFHTASPRLNDWVKGTLARFEPHRNHVGVRELLDAYAS